MVDGHCVEMIFTTGLTRCAYANAFVRRGNWLREIVEDFMLTYVFVLGSVGWSLVSCRASGEQEEG